MKTADIEVGGEYYVAEGSGSYGRANGCLAKVLATRVEYEATSYSQSSYLHSHKVTKRDGILVEALDGEKVPYHMGRRSVQEGFRDAVLVRPQQVLWPAAEERESRRAQDEVARRRREAVARLERARRALGVGELNRSGSHVLLTVEEAEVLAKNVFRVPEQFGKVMD